MQELSTGTLRAPHNHPQLAHGLLIARYGAVHGGAIVEADELVPLPPVAVLELGFEQVIEQLGQ